MALGNFTRDVGATQFDTGTTAAGALQDGQVTVTVAGSGYIVGDVVELTGGSGTGGELTVATVNASGGILTVTVTTAGTGYADDETVDEPAGTEVGVPNSDFTDHDQYEQGGNINEYTDSTQGSYKPEIPPNVLGDDQVLVKANVKADGPQWTVQKRYIDGGATTVWAEPTTVDHNGNVVGNVVRAEDIMDESRCTALGFTWVADGNGGTDGADYGYCYDGTFNADFAKQECVAFGFFFDTVLATCIDTGTVDVTDPDVATDIEAYLNGGAGDAYADDDKEVICNMHGYFWDGAACVTFASIDFGATYTTQATCDAAGGVWIAGTCYSPEDFGNGQGGDFSESEGSHN